MILQFLLRYGKIIPLVLFCTLTPFPQSLMMGQDTSGAYQQEEIQSVLDMQVNAWNSGDIAGYMDGYWKSDSLLFTSQGKIQRGWQATLQKYEKSYGTKEKMGTLKFSELEFHFLSPESAWVLGHWEIRRNADHPGGVFTLVLRKFSNGWKIIHDHTSAEK